MSAAFFDTSALVRLWLTDEPLSSELQALAGATTEHYLSVLAEPEGVGALVRAWKASPPRLSAAEYLAARDQLMTMLRASTAVEVDTTLIKEAVLLVSMYGLKTLDMLHLASAKRVAAAVGPVRFVTVDRQLRGAARQEGLRVWEPYNLST
ncbi:type II toxin-antitoxin system VapC family toxin [Myxococcota bacterium]|nr:type II toxin-antitoxin system VapC family toxin [Myxococcota bacterium]